MLALVAAAISAVVQDRSAEAEFRQVLEGLGRVRGLEARVSRSRLDDAGREGFEDATIELQYRAPGVFRLYTMGSFGSGSVFVSDGRRALEDPLGGETVFGSAAPKGFSGGSGPASLAGGLPLAFALLDGVAVLGGLVPPASPLTAEAGPGRSRVFRFQILGEARAVVAAEPDGGAWKVLYTELDNAPLAGAGGFRRREGVMRDTVVAWRKADWPQTFFATSPPPGTTLVERVDSGGRAGS